MEGIDIQFEYQRMLLEMVVREWSFMYDVMKTTLSSVLITIPIYLSIIGFLLSYLKLGYHLGLFIGVCLGIFIAILFLEYYNYVSFVEIRLQLSEKFDIYEFMKRANEQFEVARKKLWGAFVLYSFTHGMFFGIIVVLNLTI